MNEVLCSAESIFKQLTAYEIDGILHILQRHASKTCPLLLQHQKKKLAKANFLAFLLGHYKQYFPPHKIIKEMHSLAALCQDEVLRSVPDDVIRVGLSLWTLRYDL